MKTVFHTTVPTYIYIPVNKIKKTYSTNIPHKGKITFAMLSLPTFGIRNAFWVWINPSAADYLAKTLRACHMPQTSFERRE